MGKMTIWLYGMRGWFRCDSDSPKRKRNCRLRFALITLITLITLVTLVTLVRVLRKGAAQEVLTCTRFAKEIVAPPGSVGDSAHRNSIRSDGAMDGK